MLMEEHLEPTVTKRAQGILCNPLVPKLARLVPNDRSQFAAPHYRCSQRARAATYEGGGLMWTVGQMRSSP
eukprot:COSAG02_NODE_710_length_18178_cov_14.361524_7_plen_71_part_00